jgi:hypothetical protein
MMIRIVRGLALVTAVATASLWSAGCSSSVSGTDKMGMNADKMGMNTDTMAKDKMGTGGMAHERMSDSK